MLCIGEGDLGEVLFSHCTALHLLVNGLPLSYRLFHSHPRDIWAATAIKVGIVGESVGTRQRISYAT